MKLKGLFEMYENGALNISYMDGADRAILGGMQITIEQAHAICRNLGWSEYVLSPFTIIEKTAKFCKGIIKHVTDEDILDNTEIDFLNKQTGYTIDCRIKTCDRIHIQNRNYSSGFDLAIIYNGVNNPAKYTTFDCRNSLPVNKSQTLKQVGVYINSLAK